MELCDWLRLSFTKDECEECVMQMWATWNERQEKLHEGKGYHIVSKISGHMQYLQDYRHSLYQKNVPLLATAKSKPDEVWKLPVPGSWRLDVDVCYDERRGSFGTRGIIRGSDGLGIIAFGKSIPKPQSLMDGELLAIRDGLKVAKERQCFSLQIASDSLLAVQEVTNPSENLSHTGILVTEILKLMEGHEITKISHVRCSANMVAHYITKFSSLSPLPANWEGGTSLFS
ncbi:uncharacterized protein [Primulina eburnea]|uniref:uncharacterized protein n=1 Tax=Primulina eburnea TaxID=1245227 RepID=UPI003C6C5743